MPTLTRKNLQPSPTGLREAEAQNNRGVKYALVRVSPRDPKFVTLTQSMHPVLTGIPTS